MAATIKDIAKMVGVSPSTVSRVVNRTAPISEETQEKIREAMKKLNYHPNSTARNLASGASCTIGLVIDAADEGTFANSFFNRSVYAIEKTLQEHAYSLLITNNRPVSSIRSLVYEKRVDGLIIPPASLDEETVKFLEEEHFPFVVQNRFCQEPYLRLSGWCDGNMSSAGDICGGAGRAAASA